MFIILGDEVGDIAVEVGWMLTVLITSTAELVVMLVPPANELVTLTKLVTSVGIATTVEASILVEVITSVVIVITTTLLLLLIIIVVEVGLTQGVATVSPSLQAQK